jgi:hypothetical protein
MHADGNAHAQEHSLLRSKLSAAVEFTEYGISCILCANRAGENAQVKQKSSKSQAKVKQSLISTSASDLAHAMAD